jgi:hypothetical protein
MSVLELAVGAVALLLVLVGLGAFDWRLAAIATGILLFISVLDPDRLRRRA